ncbi:hypothetical protein TNCV_1173511 [Trichonephila clavipes]|uniref:Uncharacterized protein n=1 Tax=Trichonephila clavipes TaxID=2585209 RepID=A0A8X6SAD3_TRICX|nr:hypothetical protein TNCV_1173511 [Trichonephila clavipes]
MHQCATKIRALQTELEAKPPRRMRRKHMFGDGSKDVQVSHEEDLMRTMFSAIDRETAENIEICQQLQNLDQKHAFLRSEVILSMDKDQAPQDEFQLEHVRLQAFVAAADPGCKKELISSGSLGLLKYIIEFTVEDGLPNTVIMLRIFLTTALSSAREASL